MIGPSTLDMEKPSARKPKLPVRLSGVLMWPTALLTAICAIMNPDPSSMLDAIMPAMDFAAHGSSAPAMTRQSAANDGTVGPARSVQRPV